MGTQQDNMDDMTSKGRQRNASMPGASNPNAKLTAEQVAEIRSSPRIDGYIPILMKAFGVSRATIAKIRSGETWKMPEQPAAKEQQIGQSN